MREVSFADKALQYCPPCQTDGKPLADRRQLRLELHASEAEVPTEVDGFRMQQVLRNVLANALRFAPPGTAIEIDCKCMAAAGSVVSHSFDHSYNSCSSSDSCSAPSSVDSFDISGVSDDTGFDFGGDD